MIFLDIKNNYLFLVLKIYIKYDDINRNVLEIVTKTKKYITE